MHGPTCIFWANLTAFSFWQLKKEGLCKAAGFAAHVHCDQIKKIINAGKGKLGYVNLHYGFFSSKTGGHCVRSQGLWTHSPPPV